MRVSDLSNFQLKYRDGEINMGLAKLRTKISVEEYLAGEKVSPIKHEYFFGEVYAMAGTTKVHNRISGNFYTKLDLHLSDSLCQPFIADIKLRVDPNIYYYPDVFVSCEESDDETSFNEAILIIEVLSNSTTRIDRREKLGFYTRMPSVQEYVIVAQKRPLIEVHRRHENDKWITHIFSNLDDEIHLSSVDLKISVAEIYRRVVFPPAKSK